LPGAGDWRSASRIRSYCSIVVAGPSSCSWRAVRSSAVCAADASAIDATTTSAVCAHLRLLTPATIAQIVRRPSRPVWRSSHLHRDEPGDVAITVLTGRDRGAALARRSDASSSRVRLPVDHRGLMLPSRTRPRGRRRPARLRTGCGRGSAAGCSLRLPHLRARRE
jgi:hypothetical protein